MPTSIYQDMTTTSNMSETTREDIRRMTQGLTDQKTIEQLSTTGKVAQQKREDAKALRRETCPSLETDDNDVQLRGKSSGVYVTPRGIIKGTLGWFGGLCRIMVLSDLLGRWLGSTDDGDFEDGILQNLLILLKQYDHNENLTCSNIVIL